MKKSVHTCIVHSKKWTYTFESASRVAGVWQRLNDRANHNVDAIAAESCSYNGVLGTPVIHHLLRIADRRPPHKNLTPLAAPSAILPGRYLTYHCRDTLRRDCQSTYKFTFMTQRRLIRNALLTSTSISNVGALYQVWSTTSSTQQQNALDRIPSLPPSLSEHLGKLATCQTAPTRPMHSLLQSQEINYVLALEMPLKSNFQY